MSLDKEYEKQKEIYLQKFSSLPSKSHPSFLKKLMETTELDSWKILSQILSQIQAKDKSSLRQIFYFIDKVNLQIKSFPMLIYLYQLKLSKPHYPSLVNYWKSKYQEIAYINGELILFSTWLTSESSAHIVQDTLWMIAKTFPSLMNKERIQLTEYELNAVIEWVTLMETADSEKYTGACELVKLVKERHLKIKDDYIEKEQMILRKLIEVAGQFPSSSANIFLFIYPFTLRERDIKEFVYIFGDFLTEMNEESICNFFTAISKGAVSKEIICLVTMISEMLKSEDQYFKLRIIYQKYILPILIRRAKACTKAEETIFDISNFYVLGFLKHCNIGEEGIKCLLKNIGKIKNQKVKQKWISLVTIVSEHYPSYKPMIEADLAEQLKKGVKLPSQRQKYEKILTDNNVVWEVTMRMGRKHKKYPREVSKMKGIQNNSNECYIISTMQGLHRTSLLENLLLKHKQAISTKHPLINELRILFKQITKRQEHIRVSYLKKKGPELFAESHQQEDAQQYIIEFFSIFQMEMEKIPNMLADFKKIFQFKTKNTIKCNNCKKVLESEEFSYVYTIPHTQILSNETHDSLPDYKCDKCQEKKCLITRKLLPTCQILLVHINRFSHKKGKTKKELSTQTILRKFMDFELVGMICHIGKTVQHGHYVYYSRVTQKRWAEFNDKYVEEFDLGSKDEEFEREMKAEMTPYILFYQIAK